jgi:hypothetical protein
MRLVSMSFSVETLHFFGRVAGAVDARVLRMSLNMRADSPLPPP